MGVIGRKPGLPKHQSQLVTHSVSGLAKYLSPVAPDLLVGW